MMKTKLITTSLLMSCSMIANAEVKLLMDSNIELLFINSNKPTAVEDNRIGSGQGIVLPDGVNQIVFSYDYIFEEGSSRETVDTEIAVGKFEARNQTIELVIPQYKDIAEAERSRQNWAWTIWEKETQKPINYSRDILRYNGFQFSRNIAQELEKYNTTAAPASVQSAISTKTPPVSTSQPANIRTNIKSINSEDLTTEEEMLHFWYQKADEQTKQRFRAYINAQ